MLAFNFTFVNGVMIISSIFRKKLDISVYYPDKKTKRAGLQRPRSLFFTVIGLLNSPCSVQYHSSVPLGEKGSLVWAPHWG